LRGESQLYESGFLIDMRSITKSFPSVLANDKICFTCIKGEIHALLGENGAGKSVLMKVLSGIYKPDSGKILYEDKLVTFNSPRQALEYGIGMVHQELRLVETLTVAENIVLGSKMLGFIYNKKKIELEVEQLSSDVGLQVDPGVAVWRLSVGEKQRVEILKVLYREIKFLILDEPTMLLTPQETNQLFDHLKKLTSRGCTVVFITHKLEEVMKVADRVTVLRQGNNVSTRNVGDTNKRELAGLMMGRKMSFSESKFDKCQAGKVLLEISDIHATGDQKRSSLKGISFSLACGEILGVAGVAGNGQRELAESISGLRLVNSGNIYFQGKDITNLHPRRIIDAGISYIPEDRIGMGVVPDLSVADNLILKDYFYSRFGSRLILNKAAIDCHCDELIKGFLIKTPHRNIPAKLLSGGNIQRLILAREISRNPKLIVAVNPTRGLDIGAIEAIHKMFLKQISTGVGIIVISEDLDELFDISSRLIVLYEGKVLGTFDSDRKMIEDIGLAMGGVN